MPRPHLAKASALLRFVRAGGGSVSQSHSHSHSYEPRCFRSIGLLIEERLKTTARASAPTSTATSPQFGPGVAGAFVL